MEIRYLIFILLINCNLFSQDENEERGFRYSIRGKALAGPISPEDDFATTFTIGNEFLYKGYSIGIDYTFFRFMHEQDDSKDVPMYDNYKRRKYFLIDYKFVLNEEEWGDFYFNAYHKIGQFKSWYEVSNDSNITLSNSTTIIGKFNEPGIGFGIKRYWGKFGIDFSANYAHRFEKNDHKTVVSSTQIDYYNTYRERDLFYVRLNLFYEFGRK